MKRLHKIGVMTATAMLLLTAAACSDGNETNGEVDGAAGDVADGAARIDFAFEWTCSGDWVLQFLGEEQGYFDAENVDVRAVRGQGGSGTLPLVASGERDMAEISAPPAVLGAAEGLPVTVVGVLATASPVVLFADGDIKEPEDLHGKTVAVQSGEFEGGVWDAFVKQTGLDVSQMEIIPATGTSNVLFVDHSVDAFISFYLDPATYELTEGRDGEETLFFMQDYVPTYGHTFVVNDDFLEENPDAVRGFLTAMAQAMKYATEHPDESLELLTSTCPELGDESAKFTLDAYLDSWNDELHKDNGYLTFEDAGFEQTAQVLIDSDLMDASAKDALKTTTDYLPDPPVKP